MYTKFDKSFLPAKVQTLLVSFLPIRICEGNIIIL